MKCKLQSHLSQGNHKKNPKQVATIVLSDLFLWNYNIKISKLLGNLEEKKKLIDIFVEKGNRETILLKKKIENEEGIKFMTIEERYLLFEQRVEVANKILKEIYINVFLKKLRKSMKLRWRWLKIKIIEL